MRSKVTAGGRSIRLCFCVHSDICDCNVMIPFAGQGRKCGGHGEGKLRHYARTVTANRCADYRPHRMLGITTSTHRWHAIHLLRRWALADDCHSKVSLRIRHNTYLIEYTSPPYKLVYSSWRQYVCKYKQAIWHSCKDSAISFGTPYPGTTCIDATPAIRTASNNRIVIRSSIRSSSTG